MTTNNEQWTFSQESFDSMLAWLDPDRERAGEKYEEIRRQLIKIFVCRGCSAPEDLADKTINRVIAKSPEIAGSYVGNPARFFYGVAKMVHLEHLREKPLVLPPPSDPPTDVERHHECLDHCLERQTTANGELILEYYSEEKQAKIDARQRMAKKLGITPKALRLRATRIRAALQECLTDCLKTN